MKILIILPLAALALSTSANAQTGRTTTIEKPMGTATKTVTRDNGNLTVDATATRNSDGATASSNRERTRSEHGMSGRGSQTGFGGQSGVYEYDRTRDMDGWATTGRATSKQGRTFNYDAYGRKTETGRENSRNVTRDGTQVYNRTGNISRADNQVKRNVNVIRDPSFKPRKAPSRR